MPFLKTYIGLCAATLLAALMPQIVFAQDGDDTTVQASSDSDDAIANLQRMLDEQKKLIEEQKQEIDRQKNQIAQQQQQLNTTTELLTNMQSQIDQIKNSSHDEMTTEEVEMRERLAKLEADVGRLPVDPSAMLADDKFPGAIRVPGTNASYKIGGYVKATLVNNFDPLVTQDRFIVGSIPVTAIDQTASAPEASLTASQSRVNFDYRQRTDVGNLRAFVEADFAGEGDTFRLRHGFGQFRDLLAGKTWSAFYDAEAAPEEVDFEGINGRVVLRQTQIRYFPKIGKDLRLMISFEDPNPQVTGGEGVSDLPDFIASVRRDWFGGWHVKTAALLRQISAINDSGVNINTGQTCEPSGSIAPGDIDPDGCQAIADPGRQQTKIGWAVTASGKVQVPWWNENDNFLFQLNYGRGLGRYLTDLSSVASLEIDGGQDAWIDPVTGNMQALPVIGGYLAFQHWWAERLRSTFVASYVDVNNEDGQSYASYNSTGRVSGNLIWSPIPAIDVGAEFLWGKRTNFGPDPSSGVKDADATQLQIEAMYRF
jgi:TolA-binding protein